MAMQSRCRNVKLPRLKTKDEIIKVRYYQGYLGGLYDCFCIVLHALHIEFSKQNCATKGAHGFAYATRDTHAAQPKA